MEPISRSEKIAQAHKAYHGPRKSYGAPAPSPKGADGWGIPEKGWEERSFQIRLVLASFLFLAFLGLKETGKTYYTINCEKVVEMVMDNQGMEMAEEKVIAVFKRLD